MDAEKLLLNIISVVAILWSLTMFTYMMFLIYLVRTNTDFTPALIMILYSTFLCIILFFGMWETMLGLVYGVFGIRNVLEEMNMLPNR